tara:strand:- start:839 stop:1762 length:924 start_codon:yes stop_codon:yes gene_type:complete
MKILLIGGSGQLGIEFLTLIKNYKIDCLHPNSKDLDITNTDSLINFFDNNSFDIILNFSAYTNVDRAEQEYEHALAINHLALRNLVNISNKHRKPIIHISTDYVFGKFGNAPYDINSEVGALNKYGHTKLLGEKEIISNSNKAIIIRTASLYGQHKKNFFKTFLDILISKKIINVVSDQKISITWSYDLSLAIIELLLIISKSDNWIKKSSIDIIHMVNKGHTSWFEVANIISSFLNKNNQVENPFTVNPILYSDWGSKVKRPLDSRLSFYGEIPNLCELKMPNWKTSLMVVLENYLKDIDYERYKT